MCMWVCVVSISALRDQRCCVLLELELQVASCELAGVGAGNQTLLTAESSISQAPGYNLGSGMLLPLAEMPHM